MIAGHGKRTRADRGGSGHLDVAFLNLVTVAIPVVVPACQQNADRVQKRARLAAIENAGCEGPGARGMVRRVGPAKGDGRNIIRKFLAGHIWDGLGVDDAVEAHGTVGPVQLAFGQLSDGHPMHPRVPALHSETERRSICV